MIVRQQVVVDKTFPLARAESFAHAELLRQRAKAQARIDAIDVELEAFRADAEERLGVKPLVFLDQANAWATTKTTEPPPASS